MGYVFSKCPSLTSLPDISKWDTKNNENLSNMFSHCFSLLSLPDISKWDTSKNENLDYIFYECPSLCSLPNISKWKTDKVKYARGIISGSSSIIETSDIKKLVDGINQNNNI